MEHRWHLRSNHTLDAVLYYRGTRLLQCRTGDISLYGMFLISGPAYFAKNVPVEVEFALPDEDGQDRLYRARAVVIHSRKSGIGIMFRDYDPVMMGALRRFLLRPARPAAFGAPGRMPTAPGIALAR